MSETYMKKIEKLAREKLKEQYEALQEDSNQVLERLIRSAIEYVIQEAVGIRRDSWNRWEIIRGSGDNDREPLLRKKIREKAERTLKELMPNVEVSLSDRDIAQIKKVYRAVYKDQLMDAAEHFATKAANANMEEFFKEIKVED